jgi:TolA-binding protein
MPLSTTELESSLYDAAKEAYYNQKNCDVAMPKFESYISKYPEGKYIAEAHFCFAECAYSKEYDTWLRVSIHPRTDGVMP